MAGIGMGWFAKKMKGRKDKKEQDRLDRIEEERREDERITRQGAQGPPRFTGDGNPSPRRHSTRPSMTQDSEFSSMLDDPHVRPGSSIPPIPAGMGAAGGMAAAAAMAQAQSRSKQNIADSRQHIEPVSMPSLPHDPQGILHQESESEDYVSQGGGVHRRPSERRRREGEEAAAAAVAAATTLAAREDRRRKNRSQDDPQGITSPAVSVKVKPHGDKNGNVTLRRLTEQEAAAERKARGGEGSRRRADSMSSLSGTDTGASRRRYRRDDRSRRTGSAGESGAERTAESASEARAGKRVEQSQASSPPIMAPLNPPSPAFAGGRKPKDSAYYSGRAEGSGLGGPSGPGRGSTGSPESHGTWSGMSPAESLEGAAERSRRRKERNQRQSVSGVGKVDFT